ncbi:MAG: DoxX family protein [Tumebacillaceae bacterium]
MKLNNLGLTLLRVVLGAIFLAHGIQKMQSGLDKIAGFFGSVGVPSWLAYPVGYIEVIGGIVLILGLGTRVVSALLAVIMVGATVSVKLQNGLVGGYELELMLFAVSAFFVLSGQSGLTVLNLFGAGKKTGAIAKN